ncbi:MAG: proline dehydrogenase family protein [Bacteroidetes bacterium]|nr:proline dehydrogenase family protein [Bacteroidota bacterium]
MEISPDIFEDTETAFANLSSGDLQKAKALFTLVGNNSLVNVGSALANIALSLHLPVSPLFKFSVYNHFCGGETFKECKKTIQKLAESNIGVLLNYGVELKETEEDFDTTIAKNLEAIEFAGQNKSVKAVCIKITGFARFGLFEKIQQNEKLNAEEKKEFALVKKRFDKLCKSAVENEVALYIDAEESWIQHPLDKMVEEMMQVYNGHNCTVFNTFQMYRCDRLEYLQQQIEKAKTENYFLGAKLVRGAYMEKERERATELNYNSPIHKNKKAVDKDFDEAIKICLSNVEHVYSCVASHSEPSNFYAMIQMDKMKIERHSNKVLFSQLYGMGNNMTFNQAKLGFNATKYLPYGPVRDVIPYLMRRAQENTSVAGQTGRELSLIKKEMKRRKEC